MNGISYTIRLLEPVLANSLAGDVNSACSLPFVPGALIRGIVIQAYLEKNNSAELDAADPETRRLFFNGATRYLNAYPFVQTYGRRASPVPLSWRKRKGEVPPHEIYDLSVAPEETGEPLESLGQGVCCTLLGESAYGIKYEEQINVHTQRDAKKGRATKEHGAVFRYEALPAGALLAGVILTGSASEADAMKDLIDGRTILLGKARTAGYGQATVETVEVWAGNWREAEISPTDSDEERRDESGESREDYGGDEPEQLSSFTLTFLSDAIVRDEKGQHTLDPLPALRKRLNNQFNLTTGEGSIFRQSEVVGGFNRKWGLPLPQVAAIAAGSVFVIKADPPVSVATLRRLEDEGIGERRAEGFGRIAINWHSHSETLYWQELEQDLSLDEGQPTGGEVTLSQREKRLAEQFLTRLLRRDLDRQLRDAIHALSINGSIPNSQLSRWRSIARSALAEVTPARRVERLTAFLASEREKASQAWEKMRRARVVHSGIAGKEDPMRLTEWIQEVLTKEDSPWRWFENSRKPEPRALGDNVKVEVSTELTVEYQIRLIDGVLARKAKEQAKHANRGGGND
jgi:CRISPR-associated protein Csx10